jgi:hypothetical protein
MLSSRSERQASKKPTEVRDRLSSGYDVLFIFTAMRTSNPTFNITIYNYYLTNYGKRVVASDS